MFKRRVFYIFVLVILLLSGVTAVSAQRWRLLGSANAGSNVDHDTIRVTAWRGDVRRIRLRVTGAPVRFYRMTVRFNNGRTREIELRNRIPAGGYSRAIDLPGNERVIDRVDFWYEAASLGRRRARVSLYGQD